MGRSGNHAAFGRVARSAALAAGCLALAHCTNSKLASQLDPKYGVSTSARVIEPGVPIPKGGGVYRVGKPYTVAGRTYTPQEEPSYRAEGVASWYGDDFHGRLTANGEIYDMQSITAAHPTLPLPSYARVTNLANHRSIVVRVNDRGPYAGDRVIDLSVKVAQLLGFHGDGLARVRVEYVGRAPLEGSDDRKLIATLRRGGEPAPNPSEVRVAAAKPFVPEFFDTTPMIKRGGTLPVPGERPFALGQNPADAPAASVPREALNRRPTTEFTATRAPAVRSAALDTPLPARVASTLAAKPAALTSTSPVSAYAPMRYDGAAGFMSGRGLY